MQITLAEELGQEPDAAALRNLFTVYFSELGQWDYLVDLNEWGLPVWTAFGVPPPRTHAECADYNWWIRGDCRRFLIRADGRVAGFAVVNPGPQFLPPDVNYEMLDFFVAHKYRRRGVGRAAARAVFDLLPGCWEVAQLAGNRPAVTFWNSLVGEYTGGAFESLDGGTRQRFRSGP